MGTEAAEPAREAQLLKSLAHPIRLALLESLSQDEECVCHLSCLLRRPQPVVSKQLAVLREAGLVLDRRDGLRIYYRLTDPGITRLLEDLRSLTGRDAIASRWPLDGCPCPKCERHLHQDLGGTK